MADVTYPHDNSTTQDGSWQMLKLRDLGDGTFSLVASDVGGWSATRIAGAGTTVVKSGSGIFGGIIVGKSVALSTVTVYDNTAASGTVVAVITQPLALLLSQLNLMYKCKMATGITVVTSAGDDITVLYL